MAHKRQFSNGSPQNASAQAGASGAAVLDRAADEPAAAEEHDSIDRGSIDLRGLPKNAVPSLSQIALPIFIRLYEQAGGGRSEDFLLDRAFDLAEKFQHVAYIREERFLEQLKES
jgi:hypothetical protein